MSAERCGNNFKFIIHPSPEALKARLEALKNVEYKGKAGAMLKKIRKHYPNFIPASEEDIFYRARAYGLMDEE